MKVEDVKIAIIGAIQEVASLLRKSHRQLKVAALVCLEVFVHQHIQRLHNALLQYVWCQTNTVTKLSLTSRKIAHNPKTAFALENVSAGNVSKYLPIVISEINSDQRKRYLLFYSLKEIISRYSNKDGVKALGPFADDIWNILFQSGENIKEGTRGVVAECLGKLTLANPNKFLPELQKRFRSDSAQTSGTVVTAIKFTFINQGQEYDELLRPLIVDFLSLIQDRFDQLLPLLYEETLVKESLIHMVEMGPFKHKVDDGLDIRKANVYC
ncbi:armadillo-type protein [Gigaspora rosea]|uniref:Armadillo-type protein n=1 Tax=Gigaspora rosea TaxID=44941 RepID=A0A397W348_9GLOM|nr:armadillo-type protein [Gigaspora rosea]